MSFLILLFIFASSPVSAQEKQYPSTLLWRISGNHLSKPSYLYGTMHLTDRRLFYFSDSLYKCLEQSEGYAMEINPDSAVNALYRSIFSNDTTGLLKDAINSKDFAKMSKRLETEIGVPAGKITKKQLWLYSFKRGRQVKEDDMDSPMDTYLYNIARRQGKWVGGIEDIDDQINLIEDLESKFDPDPLPSKKTGNPAPDRMVDLYLARDLGKIDSWMILNTDSVFRENLLYHRNKKMAYRIDSMAAVRSNFFAVGAAHLPGKQGLLALLRAKGFTVEPVLSSGKIAPEAYTYKAIDLPWQTEQDEEKTYTVEMPGKPFLMKLPNDLTMKCYTDLGTGIIYFSMSVQYPTAVGNTDSALATVARNMANNSTIGKKQAIEYNGVRGIELTADKSNSYHYRVRAFLKGETMYMVMIGSEKKALLENKEGQRFFNSFVMHDKPRRSVPKNAEWQAFTLPGKGFTISLPGQPERNKQMEQVFRKNANNVHWGFVSYAYSDPYTGNYYMVSVKETLRGFYLNSDTVIFYDVKHSIQGQGSELLHYDTLSWQNYAAMRLKAFYSQGNLYMNCLTVCRANRVYSILVLSEKGKGDSTDGERFIRSFKLLDNPPGRWSEQLSPDGSFRTWTPQPFVKLYRSKDAGDSSNLSLITTDSISSVFYQVDKKALSPYYWVDSDSSFFADRLSDHMTTEDTLLSSKPVENGGIKGMEYITRNTGGNRLKRLRVLSCGDTSYRLYAYIPGQLQQDADIDRFFNSFRFTHENNDKPYLQDKTGRLLTDLLSHDSAVFEHAGEALRHASFSKRDLPLLYEALLHTYRDSAEGTFRTYSKIARAAAKQQDGACLSFVADHYAQLIGEKEKLKYSLLYLLALTKKQSSYNLLKQLLLLHPPRAGDPGILEYAIVDSIPLAASLFPDLLPLGRDTAFAAILPYILMKLIDSNQLSPAVLVPYNKDYYAMAKTALKDPDDIGYDSEDLVRLTGTFKDEEATRLLQQFLQVRSVDIKETAALALIKSNRVADPLQMEKIAADNSNRADLYNELVKCGKENFFPSKYHTQKSFAASEVYRIASDNEYDSITVSLAGERTAMFMNRQKTFYLFKVTYKNEDGGPVSHLGIAGPYSPGSAHLLTTSDASDIYTDEEYDPTKLTGQFKALLKTNEERLKKKKEED